jgi:acyl-CoA reductase-like NAD-dependent aldehyde dehydrogenase
LPASGRCAEPGDARGSQSRHRPEARDGTEHGAGETRRAIEAAAAALPAWAKKTAQERAVILRRWYDLMLANQEDLARIMTAEQGKPLAEARGEIAYAAGFIEWFGEEGKRLYGDVIPGIRRTSASSCCANRSAWSRPSRRGIFRRR